MGIETTQGPIGRDDASAIDLGQMLVNLAAEIHETAAHCRLIQEAVSHLLTELHHPDLRAEIQVLQGIDLIQQTLEDASALLQASANSGIGRDIPRHVGRDVLRLDSFRKRIGLDDTRSDGTPAAGQSTRGSVDWL